MLMAGPKFDLEWEFGSRLKQMSAFSSGDLVTSSSASSVVAIGKYRVHSIDLGKGKSVFSRFRYFRKCWQVASKARADGHPVDVIITYDPMMSGVVGLILAWRFRARLVCEINGDYSATANYTSDDAKTVKRMRRFLTIRVARFVLNRSNGIKLLFPDQLERLGAKASADQTVRCFPDFVNTRAFSDLGEQPNVLLVGFPLYVKGVDIAIRAFKRIQDSFPDWTLTIMGYYPDRRVLDNFIDGNGAIVIQKPVLHRHMNEHIGRCAILLQPSRTEAMGRVLIEAMTAGKPVVVSDVDGIPAVLGDSGCGVMVPVEDVAATARALAQLMADDALRAEMGRKGRLRAQAAFSEQQYFPLFSQFLQDVRNTN